jgi:hypothetical protein
MKRKQPKHSPEIMAQVELARNHATEMNMIISGAIRILLMCPELCHMRRLILELHHLADIYDPPPLPCARDARELRAYNKKSALLIKKIKATGIIGGVKHEPIF